jgi:hypothetical protein
MAQGTNPSNEAQVGRSEAEAMSDPHAPRMPYELHGRLAAFIGRWSVTGRNAEAAPDAPNSPISGENSFEWLPGQFFVVARFRHDHASGTHAGASILGVDEESGALFARNFDNLGYERKYSVSIENGVWRFVGRFERAALVFGQDGLSYEERWEISKDGVQFAPLCEMRAAKLGAHASQLA